MASLGEVIKSLNVWLKLLEVLLAVASLVLTSGVLVGGSLEKIAVVDGALVSCTLLGAQSIAGELLGTPVDKALHLVGAGVLALLCFAAGAFMFEVWDSVLAPSLLVPEKVMVAGFLTLSNAMTYVVDFTVNSLS
ncbi:uncharacterized protein [Periplaneta americana]|uniref:uncharacterized protein n=1 Tax=Periplaneta americana TaxID=6978 RepID=UPI0037E7F55F